MLGYDIVFNCAYCEECFRRGEKFLDDSEIVPISVEQLKRVWRAQDKAHCAHCDKLLFTKKDDREILK